ncbi:hypothetical protein [Hymenobacter chitinivorans]|uniref:Uncharacterized protein n=1 Tax=Hymenobacter chitinivorans DSM 11115 TaxID=1121954 RepID=A0A2M9AQZ4_9BACT|nr:hypothetical protein [Hymenobacter chitinivorans]PJJ48108.1 hypothetical protein CLV45_4801 [Hymenobacter chitinivorans DSM 11115]
MARVTGNSLLRGLSGTLGNITVRQVGDQTIVSVAEGPKKAPRSPKQQEHLDRFAAAKRWATAQVLDPAGYALYATGVDDRHGAPYHVAVADYMHAPTITATDLSAYHGQPGQLIRVRATDNFAVAAVVIRILGPDQQLLETGPAQPQPDGLHWLYPAQTLIPTLPGTTVEVRATDRPGNAALARYPL